MARKRGWHFLDHRMRSRCGAEKPWRVGEVREVEGPIGLCRRGYHASVQPLDAISYCLLYRPRLCRVEESREIVYGSRKMVARRRRLLWALTVKQTERVLREFVRHVAGEDDSNRSGVDAAHIAAAQHEPTRTKQNRCLAAMLHKAHREAK